MQNDKETWQSILYTIVVAVIAVGAIVWHCYDKAQFGQQMYEAGLYDQPGPHRKVGD